MYPNYSAIDFGSSVVSLKEVQGKLDDQTLIVEYNLGENKEYGLLKQSANYIHDCNCILFRITRMDDQRQACLLGRRNDLLAHKIALGGG